MATKARGDRNNNPGNIRKGPAWQGLMPRDKMNAAQLAEKEFAVFKDVIYGIRAIAITLITYQDKRKAKDGSKIDTIKEVIDRWAPPSENNTRAYQAHVGTLVGVRVDDTINVHEYRTMKPLVEAIIEHELGYQPYTDAQIDKGLALAGVEPERRSLAKSRTVVGGTVTSAGGAGAPVMEIIQTTQDALSPLTDYLEVAKWICVGLIFLGVGITIYARWDDFRKLAR